MTQPTQSSVRSRVSLGARLIAAFLAAVGLSELWQVVADPRGLGDDPAVITIGQAAAGLLATAAAVAAWRGSRHAPAVTIAWGVAAAALLVSLTPVLGLPREEMFGIWFGALCVLAIAAAAAAYLRRRLPTA